MSMLEVGLPTFAENPDWGVACSAPTYDFSGDVMIATALLTATLAALLIVTLWRVGFQRVLAATAAATVVPTLLLMHFVGVAYWRPQTMEFHVKSWLGLIGLYALCFAVLAALLSLIRLSLTDTKRAL